MASESRDSRFPKDIGLKIAVSWAFLSFAMTAWIEFLNDRAGGFLQHVALQEEHSKWRDRYVTTEERWRDISARKQGDESLLSRPLSNIEIQQLNQEIRHNRTVNALHDWVVRSLIQFPVAVLVGPILLAAIFRRDSIGARRILAAIALLLMLSALGLAWFRQYFQLLGW